MPNNNEKPASKKSIAAAALNAHASAGFTGLTYAGLSKPRNSGVAKPANTGTSKATARTIAQLTPRMLATLTEIGKAHGAAAFPLIGVDRGQAAIFLNSGFFADAGTGNVKLAGDAAKRFIPAKPKK